MRAVKKFSDCVCGGAWMSSSDLKCKLQLSFREEFECYEMFFPSTQRSFSNVNTPTKACFLVYHTRYLSWRCWVFYMMSCWKLMLGVKVSLNTCSMKATVEIYAVFWIKLLQRLKKKKKKNMDCELSEVNWICPYFFFKKKKKSCGERGWSWEDKGFG